MSNIEDIYPLSPLQQGMLFHSLLEPETGAYVNQCRCLLRGGLDPGGFYRTWQKVVERHAILRTAFVWQDQEQPLQVVRRTVALPWEELDWRDLEVALHGEGLRELAAAERQRSLSFTKAPLMRFRLIRLEEDSYAFLWTFHHLLLDGWSTPLLLQEVFAIYHSLLSDREPGLLPVRPYRDYIEWLERQSLERAEEFWRGVLTGFAAPTPLGIDRSADSSAPELYEECRLESTAESSAALQALLARQKVTLNTAVQGAWALLLQRYSGEEDVIFGTVVSGRPPELPGVESIIGLFINTLPVRVRLPATERLMPWLRALQSQQARLRQYEYSPLVRVQGWSELPPGQPLFESLVIFENYPVASESIAPPGEGLQIHGIESSEQTNYPLTLIAVPGPGTLLFKLHYASRRFDRPRIQRLLRHLETLLAGMVAGPQEELAKLSLLTAAERQVLVREWSDTATGPPAEHPCVHETFAARARRSPDTAALACEPHLFTYGELNRRANRLAHGLRRLGVRPEMRVGILLERSPELLVGLFGVLKAGGAYVPLDPSFPLERLRLMAEDASLSVLLTEESLAGLLSGDWRQLRLDADWQAVAGESTADPEPWVDAANLAYVIYTSGSTGRPKGVQIPHGALASFLAAMARQPGLRASDRLLALTTLSFDIAALELLLPLVAGGSVELARRDEAADGRRLADRLAASAATVVQATPATWRLLTESGWPGCAWLLALCGGEALERGLAERLLAATGELWNLY
ncbi:MAG TPA: condensation domain-containing protein, partial [Thermoanaerobaculia bacterium]|nr:condensation domain-containing protein [Thermoanaerobaculia bacterium]